MEKHQLQYMLTDLIYFIVREKICNTKDNIALRFDFCMKKGGARSLLFYSANPNRNYVGVYWLKYVNDRIGGRFPAPGSDDWQFVSDHDCMTSECIRYFFDLFGDNITGWDWFDPYKVINCSSKEIEDMRVLRRTQGPYQFR